MKSKNKKPKKGEKIYIPTSMYISRGEDDIAGGLATIDYIEYNKHLEKDNYNYCMVGLKEVPGISYNYKYLLENQNEWKKEYAGQIAHPDPDNDAPYFHF